MNEEMIALAQRLIDCPRFRWMPGMSSVAYRQPPLEPVVHRIGDLKLTPYPGSLPNLSDPATLGCLLYLVREAWGRDTWVQHEDEWTCFVVLDNQLDHYCGTSEAEALVVALLAAP